MATTHRNPQALLRRYPAVDASERAALVAWVRALRPGALVALLADAKAEPKLLELHAREPELQADGQRMWLRFVMVAALSAAALLFSLMNRMPSF